MPLLLLLLLLFVVVPAAEIYVLIQVGQVIGALPTVLLLVADALLGAWLSRREGRKAWRALQEALGAHRVPSTEVADGALVVVGGAFLLTPGFLTDIVGVLCLLPPTRAGLRRALTRLLSRRLLTTTAVRRPSDSSGRGIGLRGATSASFGRGTGLRSARSASFGRGTGPHGGIDPQDRVVEGEVLPPGD